jgi:predicted Fe-Mo cluster-binding NifX family protein
MRVAVPTRDGLVDAHFGHCEHFMVYSLDEKKKIVAEEKIDSPEGCGCKSNIAGILARIGVTLIVAGNMGEGAVHVLQSYGIDVIRGASGNARQAAEQFALGTLADSRESCPGHGSGQLHGDDCSQIG